jgi:hypothetical protein
VATTLLPVLAIDLVKELAASIPERCIGATESLEAAHRYAGKRELVNSLVLRLRATEERDPTKPLLRK